MEKIKKHIANLKVAGKLKLYRMTVLVIDISDPFKYREDHGGLVSGIGRSAGIRNNDCKI